MPPPFHPKKVNILSIVELKVFKKSNARNIMVIFFRNPIIDIIFIIYQSQYIILPMLER